MKPAIADAEIDLAVGAEDQAVQVVAEEGDPHAVARAQHLPHVGSAHAARVAEPIQARDAGEVNIAAAGEQPGADPVDDVMKAVGEQAHMVRLAVARAIFQQPDAIVLFRIVGDALLEMLSQHRAATFDGGRGHVVVKPIHVPAIILDAVLDPKRLGDIHPPQLIDRQTNRISHHRLRRPQLDLQAVRDRERRNLLLAFIRGRGDVRRIWGDGLRIGTCRPI